MKLKNDAAERVSLMATWSSRIAMFSATLIISALFLHRLFSVPTPVALNLLKLSILGGLLSLALAALAVSDIWRNGSRGVSRMLVGGLLALVVVGWPLGVLPQITRFPEINDVSTDMTSPPEFQALAARRVPGANVPQYPGEAFAEQQREAYPDLKPLLVNRSVAEAYEVSIEAVRRLGMTAVNEMPPGDEAPARGFIEAYDRTLVWGFYDDVIVRVVGNRLTAQVDIRSASRYGRHDLGRNAERTRRLLREIVARLEATVSRPRQQRPSRTEKTRRR